MEQQQTFDKDKVLARIKKMLTLANDAAASEGERDNAMRMAHATLAKYNLSLAEANAADTSKQERRLEDSFADYGYPWTRRMAQELGRLFFCGYFFVPIRSDKVRHYFVGRESNVITARDMCAFVIKSILSEANRRMRAEGQTWAWHTSFCKGASARVMQRAANLRAEAERASEQKPTITSTGTSLVLASLYKQELDANKALMEQMHPDMRTQKSRERSAQWDGYEAGKRHGDTISLNRQVGQSSHKKLT